MVEFNFAIKELGKYIFIVLVSFGVFFGSAAFLMKYMEEKTSNQDDVAWLASGLMTFLYFRFVFWLFD